MSSTYDVVRAAVSESGSDSRVEVNQRALIDKILARYASAGAVYRELLQNSNDAEATMAEIYITTTASLPTSDAPQSQHYHQQHATPMVTQVVYRNNGLPFRVEDWSRLKKIAEGNPDVNKVGAFGVGAYTMFSICEEPLIISGNTALAFIWKGDALWTRTALPDTLGRKDDGWTTFVLPSRDSYKVPDMVEFGQFLCISLTFTQCLNTISVFIDNKKELFIHKRQVDAPRVVSPPKTGASSWWRNDGGTVTNSSHGIFHLAKSSDGSITENVVEISATLDGETSMIRARYVSAIANTKISTEMAKRMERVTKKNSPQTVHIQVFVKSATERSLDESNVGKGGNTRASKITDAFAPTLGKGRIFIGFRTSQTTGLAAHLAAPLIPTVEREAIDFQDPSLRVYNTDLLECAGMVMRLALEHSMALVGERFDGKKDARLKEEEEMAQKQKNGIDESKAKNGDICDEGGNDGSNGDSGNNVAGKKLAGFAKFMAFGMKKKFFDAVKAVDMATGAYSELESEWLNPSDPRPLCHEEREAIILMRSFCPQQSTPDFSVGTALAEGFVKCLPHVVPPVLTRNGVVRGIDARLPNNGMEVYVKENVVRKVVYRNASEYHDVIALCPKLQMKDVIHALQGRTLEQIEVVHLIKWWTKYCRVDPHAIASHSQTLKESIVFLRSDGENDEKKINDVLQTYQMSNFAYLVEKEVFADELPMPPTVLPNTLREALGSKALADSSLSRWFVKMPIAVWIPFICRHPALTEGNRRDSKVRLLALAALSKAHGQQPGARRATFELILQNHLADKKCLPYNISKDQTPSSLSHVETEYPSDLYLNSAELAEFDQQGSDSGSLCKRVSADVMNAGVSEDFLLCIGVRKTIAIEFLFTQLGTLKWGENPKPLIAYLRRTTLTSSDIHKLQTTQYLPAVGDKSRTYAPAELHLPNADLSNFLSFINILQWPNEGEDLSSDWSKDGNFLRKLGCKSIPPLSDVMKFIVNHTLHDAVLHGKCLDFVCKHLAPGKVYEKEFAMSRSSYMSMKFLPSVRIDPLDLTTDKDGNLQRLQEMSSPDCIFSNNQCMILGIPVLLPDLDGECARLYCNRFKCATDPPCEVAVRQILDMVTRVVGGLKELPEGRRQIYRSHVLTIFGGIFNYMSSQTSGLNKRCIELLKSSRFIPCAVGNSRIVFHQPKDVYFSSDGDGLSSLTSLLFSNVDFSPFLAAIGVKTEASDQDLLQLLVSSPRDVYETIGGHSRYLTLLRRISASPTFKVTEEVRESPFLLGYQVKGGIIGSAVNENATPRLAKAADISIVDNSLLARMFPVLRAPQESDLEDFYALVGSRFISEQVVKTYDVIRVQRRRTSLTEQFTLRLQERAPLLVSSNVSSRPLVPNAASVLDESQLEVCEAAEMVANFRFGSLVEKKKTTCCATSKVNGKGKAVLYITPEFDWFDVGYAVGGLILRRCVLEDAFLISSLLEVDLDQLKSRGFAVDRILKPAEPSTLEVPPDDKDIGEEPTSSGGANAAALSKENQPKTDIDTPVSSSLNTATATATERNENTKTPGDISDVKEVVSTLKDMFPDCDEKFLIDKVGSNPTLEKVSELANQLAQGHYPKSDSRNDGDNSQPADDTSIATMDTQATEMSVSTQKSNSTRIENDHLHKKRFPKLPSASKLFGHRPSSIRGPKAGRQPPSIHESQTNLHTQTSLGETPPFKPTHDDGNPVQPQADIATHRSLEETLRRSVRSSREVDASGVSSPETIMTHLPEGLDHGCEIIPGHRLDPFKGPYGTGKAKNGIRVFSSRKSPSSKEYFTLNFDVVDKFATVLADLCQICSLQLSTVAIVYEPSGSTIAFNSGRSLHFNIRFFISLHYNDKKNNKSCEVGQIQQGEPDASCYAYWFTTMAHELAHNLVSAHNKEHGYYTESYVSLFIPKFVKFLATKGIV